MNSKEITLENGMKLVLINSKKFKTVNVGVFFEDELNDKNITCDKLLVKLLTSKTGVHPSIKEFNDYLKDLYGTSVSCMTNIMGDTYSFCIYANCINKKYAIHKENLLEKQFQVLNEVLEKPVLNDFNYFKEMKSEYRLNLLNDNNTKEFTALKETNRILGKNNKLVVIKDGYLDELDGITYEDFENKYNSLKTMATKIIVAGEFDENEVISYANKYLNLEASRSTHSYLTVNDMKKYEDKVVDSKFNQSAVVCVYDLNIRIGDELYYPAVVFNELFDYYLFKIVREEYNFCYSIYSIYYESRGICLLRTNIEEKNYDKTLEIVENILNDLRNTIDDKALKICKEKIVSKLEKSEDNSFKIISNNYVDNIYSMGTINDQIQEINKVSKDSIIEVAKMMEKKFNVLLKEGK